LLGPLGSPVCNPLSRPDALIIVLTASSRNINSCRDGRVRRPPSGANTSRRPRRTRRSRRSSSRIGSTGPAVPRRAGVQARLRPSCSQCPIRQNWIEPSREYGGSARLGRLVDVSLKLTSVDGVSNPVSRGGRLITRDGPRHSCYPNERASQAVAAQRKPAGVSRKSLRRRNGPGRGSDRPSAPAPHGKPCRGSGRIKRACLANWLASHSARSRSSVSRGTPTMFACGGQFTTTSKPRFLSRPTCKLATPKHVFSDAAQELGDAKSTERPSSSFGVGRLLNAAGRTCCVSGSTHLLRAMARKTMALQSSGGCMGEARIVHPN